MFIYLTCKYTRILLVNNNKEMAEFTVTKDIALCCLNLKRQKFIVYKGRCDPSSI